MPHKPTTQCPNNEGVYCAHTADCATCGWNPEVAEERAEAIRRKYGIEEE